MSDYTNKLRERLQAILCEGLPQDQLIAKLAGEWFADASSHYADTEWESFLNERGGFTYPDDALFEHTMRPYEQVIADALGDAEPFREALYQAIPQEDYAAAIQTAKNAANEVAELRKERNPWRVPV